MPLPSFCVFWLLIAKGGLEPFCWQAQRVGAAREFISHPRPQTNLSKSLCSRKVKLAWFQVEQSLRYKLHSSLPRDQAHVCPLQGFVLNHTLLGFFPFLSCFSLFLLVSPGSTPWINHLHRNPHSWCTSGESEGPCETDLHCDALRCCFPPLRGDIITLDAEKVCAWKNCWL